MARTQLPELGSSTHNQGGFAVPPARTPQSEEQTYTKHLQAYRMAQYTLHALPYVFQHETLKK